MREHYVNSLDNFIMGFYIDNDIVCDNLIDYFYKNKNRHVEGQFGVLFSNNSEVKKTLECQLTDSKVFSEYDVYLRESLTSYHKKHYEYSDVPLEIPYPPQIQKYVADQGHFNNYHCESAPGVYRNRQLVFMTYLNTLEEGNSGETEFLFQKLKIRPEKGLTLIWPTAFTHIHKGLMPKNQDKYIITGWFYDQL